MPPTPLCMAEALEFHRAGNLSRAETLYREVLSREPNHADALHFLGVLAAQAGHPQPGLDLIDRAIALDPAAPHFRINRGNILRDLDRTDEAIESYHAALRLRPSEVSAYVNLANALRRMGRLEDAAEAARSAAWVQPDEPELHFLLGVILAEQNQPAKAVQAFELALELRPDFTDAQEQLDRARQASAHRAAAEPVEAEWEQPSPEPMVEADAASGAPAPVPEEETARAAPEPEPELAAESWQPEAPPPFETPPQAKVELPDALQGAAGVDDVIATWRPVVEPPLPVPVDDASVSREPARSAAEHSRKLVALHEREHELVEIFDEHRWWNDLHAADLEREAMPHFIDLDPGRRLRIGYVSPDLRDHAVGRFLLPVLEGRDRSTFEVVCYASAAPESADAVTSRLHEQADAWHDVAALPDDALAARIRAHQIDVLVDLAGHMPGNRLLAFARKPAPVQVTWMGYPDTTGMTAIDHRLSDAIADPPGHPSGAFSTETLVRLDESLLCLRLREEELPALERVRRRRVVFGCFEDFSKASPKVMALWGRIITSVPGARLVLMNPGFETEAAAASARTELRRCGVATDRVELIGAVAASADRLALYNRIDVALDPYPYSGPAATADALSMGVPVVTLSGPAHASRVSASLLAAAGLSNLITTTPEAYAALAGELGRAGVRSLSQRRAQRDAVRESPLCDEARFTKKLEDAYRRMWRQFCTR